MDTTTIMSGNATTLSSPCFTTPVKNTSRTSGASISDIEAAASLIGFAESGGGGGASSDSSQELESLNQEILIPLEEMILLIENRLEFLEETVDKMIAPRSSSRGQSSDECDNDPESSRIPKTSPTSLSQSLSHFRHFKSDESPDSVKYPLALPPPKFVPKRNANGAPSGAKH